MVNKFTDMSIREFSDALASGEPVPGGGGASALCAALAASLGSMVTALTSGKKKYADTQEELEGIIPELESFRQLMFAGIQADADVFYPLSQAYSLPKDTPEEIACKTEIIERLSCVAARAPLELMENILSIMKLLERLSVIGSRMVISDVGVGMYLAEAALESSALNVYINTKFMQNREVAKSMNGKADKIKEDGITIAQKVSDSVVRELRG